ncbi:MAG TPA: MlaD family protein [Solirubrobacteraceae bacterium]|jgi:phospholipid/cholesterol/gamma-HCH transport system substrate-binding protein|nr:MlaD family protein [Solirubrobacteraceae bacterium]
MRIRNLGVKSAVLLLLMGGALVILAYYFKTAGGTLPFSRSPYVVNVYVHDPQDLLDHADIDSAGVTVGEVYNLENSVINGQTVAHAILHLDKTLTPIYKNATYEVGQKSLVGENYLEINRGTPSAGAVPNNGYLPASADQDAVALDTILNSLTPNVRNDIGSDLRQLGASLHGQGTNLNTLLGALQPTVTTGGEVFSILGQQKQQVADVVQQVGTVFQAIDNRTADLQTLIRAAKTTAQAVAARDTAFEQAFQQFPSTLEQARTSLSDVSGFATQASPVVGNLSTAMRDLRPLVNELGPTATDARGLIRELQPLINQANPLLASLNTFSSAAPPTFPELTNMMLQLDPVLDYMKPYYHDVAGALATFGSGFVNTKYETLGLCGCPVSQYSLAQNPLTGAESAALNSLEANGLLTQIPNIQDNGMKPPDSLPTVGDTSAKGLTYPHVNAAAPGSAG